ncbi:MAG TPA: TonB-dependent receptor [Coleofasciculaceae cyanobacterium]
MNINYLIDLSCCGLVGYAYFLLATSVEAQVTPELSRNKVESKENKPITTFPTSAKDLLAQQNLITRVTGVELDKTNTGLEVILKTAAGGQRLVPLILPEGNDLVIDILDATLAFSIRNGVTKTNPAPGINSIALTKVNDNSIGLTVTGETQTPSAEVILSQQNLVLSINPEARRAQETPDEEIEIIATGEGQDDYYVLDASTATGTDTPIKDTPLSIQVVPQKVLEDRNVTELGDALETVGGVVSAGGRGTSVSGPGFLIRGFDGEIFRDGIAYFSLAPLSTSDVESLEVLKGPASVLFGQGQPGGIINLVSKKPLSEPFYEASFTAGNFNTYRGDLDVSGPLNDSKTVRYRLNLSYENYESFRDFVNGERFLVSPTLTWDIGANTSINFYGQYVSDRETTDEGLVAFGDGIVDVPKERFFGEDFGEFEQDQFNLGYTFNHQFNEDWSVGHTLQYIQYNPKRFGTLTDSFDESRELARTAYTTGGDYNRFFTNAEVVSKFKTGSVQHQLLFGTEYRHDAEDPSFQFPPYPSINVFNPVYTEEPFDFAPEFFRDDNVDTIGVYLQDQIQNVSTPDPVNPLFSIQTGEVASRGIELNLGGEILPGWNITTGYTYLDAFVTEDNTDIVDNSLANVPDNQFSLWTTYELQKGNLEGLGFGLGFLYLSDRFGDLDNSYTLPGYFRTDAALFYERNNWRAQLNIENLFDIDYFSASRFGNSGSRLSVDPGAPFTILSTISLEF